ncbi:MAG: DUF1496 domain-containing protein [Gammaproteobacteria bacterium]|jgi:hypothetical protein
MAKSPASVGAPNPDLKTSPILDEEDEEYEVLAQEVEEKPICYFNNVTYSDGSFICSGSGVLLKCQRGLWLREGGCDPDNP